MLKIPSECDRDTSSAKLTDISRQDSPDSLLDVSVGICYRALVDESGVIRTQMRTHNTSEMVTVRGMPERYHPVTVTAYGILLSPLPQLEKIENIYVITICVQSL
jgi:hypothetical protein